MLNRTVVLGTLLAGAAACVHAQWLNYPDPQTPRTRDGKPNLTAPAPRARDGKPDLSGVWEPKPTPASEITRALGDDFFDLQVDLVDGSKYTLNLFWDLKPEEVPLRPEAAALLKQHEGIMLAGWKGVGARMEKVSPERRREIAQKAIAARWAKRSDRP